MRQTQSRHGYDQTFGTINVLMRDMDRSVSCTISEQNQLAVLAQNGDSGANDRLYRSLGKYILHAVYGVWKKNRDVQFNDLVSSGNIAYMNAVRTYNQEQGNFRPYVYHGIVMATIRLTMKERYPGFGTTQEKRKILSNIGSIRNAFDKYGKDDEGLEKIEEEYGIRMADLRAFLLYQKPVSLEQTLFGPDSDATVEDSISDADHVNSAREKALLYRFLEEAYNLTVQDVREQYGKKASKIAQEAFEKRKSVLDMRGVYYRAEGKTDASIAVRKTEAGIIIDEGKDIVTLEIVAENIGISRERVRQIQESNGKIFRSHLSALLRRHTGGTALSL